MNALAPTWWLLSRCEWGGSSGSSWMKVGSGFLVDRRPCLNLFSLPMMVWTECSMCLLMSGDDNPGHVTNHPASVALQKVLTGG